MTALQKRSRLLSLQCSCATAYASGAPSPWIKTSESDMAHRIGLWLRNTGRSAPEYCEPSRGYKWRVNGMILSFSQNSDTPERIA